MEQGKTTICGSSDNIASSQSLTELDQAGPKDESIPLFIQILHTVRLAILYVAYENGVHLRQVSPRLLRRFDFNLHLLHPWSTLSPFSILFF